jgi:CDGSH-type Zn-finger protein
MTLCLQMLICIMILLKRKRDNMPKECTCGKSDRYPICDGSHKKKEE